MQRLKFAFKLFYLLMIFTVNSAIGNDLNSRRSQEIEIEVDTGVIFSERISELNKLCKRPNGCWLPKPIDIDVLERNMTVFLLSSKEPYANGIGKTLNTYKRKYFGFKRNDDRWILVVGLCLLVWHKDGPSFPTVKRPGTDMGMCYFSVEYNVKNGTFSNLYIDGEA